MGLKSTVAQYQSKNPYHENHKISITYTDKNNEYKDWVASNHYLERQYSAWIYSIYTVFQILQDSRKVPKKDCFYFKFIF